MRRRAVGMRAVLPALLALIGPATAACRPPAARVASEPRPVPASCWQPPTFTEHIHSYIRTLVGGTDTTLVRVRTAFGLPAISPDSVQVVTNGATCSAVADALEAQVHKDPAVQIHGVLVIRIGSTRYAALDGRARNGELAWYLLDAELCVIMGVTT